MINKKSRALFGEHSRIFCSMWDWFFQALRDSFIRVLLYVKSKAKGGFISGRGFKDPVLSIMHCPLQKSAAIFLMLKNPVGLIALCNPFESAMSVVERLFMYLIY